MMAGLKTKRTGAGLALLKGIAVFGLTLVGLSIVSVIEVKVGITSPASIFVPYLVAGAFLNIAVFRNLIEWHPVWNTLDIVSGTKIKMLIFWPIAYPVLFLRLAVATYL